MYKSVFASGKGSREDISNPGTVETTPSESDAVLVKSGYDDG